MDHSHMDHGHMDHDMPGMGGDGPKCNMNVRSFYPTRSVREAC
jgi:copper transporter 1